VVEDRLPPDTRPNWSKEPFYRFFDYLETERRLLYLAANGIRGLVGQEKIAEALHSVAHLTETPEEEAQSRLETARQMAALAKTELDADFPLLHAHSLIGVWGALESLVGEVVRGWIRHRPSILKSDAFAGVKIPLADFHRMKTADRADYLAEAIRPQDGTQRGFQRLEGWLERIELCGPLDDALRRGLIESWEVRNVYAHRRGLADHKARDNCPWRKREWKLGQPIAVSHADYERHTMAIHDYVFELIVRAGAKFDFDVRTYTEQLKKFGADGRIEWRDDGRVAHLKPAKRRAGSRTPSHADASRDPTRPPTISRGRRRAQWPDGHVTVERVT
jgi:hypothetical protein